MLEKQLKHNSNTTKKWLELPNEYAIAKFYEFGLQAKYNKFNNTYQCGCPICREGKSLGRKKRCYYTPDKNLVYCHNCGWSSTPYNWIRQVSGMDHDDISKELVDGEYDYVDITNNDNEFICENIPSLPEDCVNLFDPIQINYWSTDSNFKKLISYMEERRLFVAANRPDAYYFTFKDNIHKNRLIIPFKDVNGDIVYYQSRKIFDWDDKPKYTSKINGHRTLFGIDKLDPSDNDIFIFEGPIDSTFVKNAIAVGGISEKGEIMFSDTQEEQWKSLLFYRKIWVLDSQWIDKTSLVKSEALIKAGESVFIWPEKFGKKYKDFNAICSDKKINQISKKFILDNTYTGIQGEIKLKLISNS